MKEEYEREYFDYTKVTTALTFFWYDFFDNTMFFHFVVIALER